MKEIAISYGTYFQYLRPTIKSLSIYNNEAQILNFNDGEIAVKFTDSVRGKHVFIFGDTTHNKTELEMTIDAARRSSAGEITVVLPYYGYARQDKKGTDRANIGASVIALILQSLGVNRVVAIDLHADQIQGNFQIPFEHIYGKNLFLDQAKAIMKKAPNEEWVLCSPDAGGVQRVKSFAKALGMLHVIIDKQRDKPGSIESMQLIGDVKGKNVILIDDIVDTGGTLIKGNEYLKEMGAKSVYNIITHPVLSQNATEKIRESKIHLITSNTRNSINVDNLPENIQIIDCSDIIHQAILNIAQNKSIITTLTQ